MDYMLRATAANGQIQAFACITRETVETARMNHDTSPVVTAALGRLLSAVAMMGWQMKSEKDQLTLIIRGDGPVERITADADCDGNVWGFALNPHVDLPPKAAGKLDVSGAVGKGTLQVIQSIGMKEPYIGNSELVSGEIAEDLAYYYTVSEQLPSAVSLGVLVDRDCSVKAAGGFIFHMMPGATDETAEKLQDKIMAFPSVTSYLSEEHTPEEMLEALLGDMDLQILDKREVRFHCNCSREKVTNALRSLTREDLLELADEKEDIELYCDCCHKKYIYTTEELTKLAQEAIPGAKEQE